MLGYMYIHRRVLYDLRGDAVLLLTVQMYLIIGLVDDIPLLSWLLLNSLLIVVKSHFRRKSVYSGWGGL